MSLYAFGTDPGSYKSNKVMKRQAVQFRVFAYGDNHVGLGELTPQVKEVVDFVKSSKRGVFPSVRYLAVYGANDEE